MMEKGDKIGRYEILELLGSGGMGSVYLARDTELERKVAIKVLNSEIRQNANHVKRFKIEARAASKLNHPNILMIYEIGDADGASYIVSEYIEGQTLRHLLDRENLSTQQVIDIGSQIAGAVSAAHAAHILHRDIKPENIIVRPDGYVKILDFGLAKITERQQAPVDLVGSTAELSDTSPGIVMGTANYMSPEQSRGVKVDERTDIFSLGIVIYEMMTGRRPFAGTSVTDTIANLLHIEPLPMARFANGVPDELQRIVSKCLKKMSSIDIRRSGT